MTDKVLKVLGVHGLGDQRASGWAEVWTGALESAFPNVPGLAITPEFMSYDDIFETTEISFAESVSAIWKLAKSGVSEIGRRDRGFVSDISDRIKWTAGYVVAWAEDEKFQQKTRNRVFAAIREHQPDIVLAHSLGSLITYNAFTHSDAKKGGHARVAVKSTLCDVWLADRQSIRDPEPHQRPYPASRREILVPPLQRPR